MRAQVWSLLTCGLLIGVGAQLASSALAADDVSQSSRPRYLSVDPETGAAIKPAFESASESATPAAVRAADCGGGKCQCIGESFEPFLGTNRYRGNVFEMTETSQLSEIKFELAFASEGPEVDLYFSVHGRAADTTDVFTPVFVGEAIPSVGIGDLSDGVQQIDRQFYSSGTIGVLGPVELLAGREYAIAVAWDDSTVGYARSIGALPPFSDGNVLGQVSKNNVEPPMVGDILVGGITPNGAYSMQICLEPKPGACCLPGNVCSDLIEEECSRLDGVFSEEKFLCDELELPEEGGCPLAEVGCCLPDGTCVDIDRFSCDRNDGEVHLDMLCAEDPCAPRGACCHDDASCTFETQEACENQAGAVYQGDDTNCVDDAPACRAGGCCLGDSCVVVAEATCATSLGIFQGLGTDCSNGPCENPGACCTATGCLDAADGMNEGRCIGLGGTYQGDWTHCQDLPTSCGEGACCIPALGCLETTIDLCEGVLEGSYRGDSTNCATLDPLCDGLCCWSLGCVDGVEPRDCAALPGGVFNSDAVACDDTPCGDTSGARACCLADGSCVDAASQAVCADQLSGEWDAMNTCSPGLCQAPLLEACCIANGCELLTQADCIIAGGVFHPGDDCSLTICADGACCKDDGTCVDALAAVDCRASGEDGNFFAGRTCADEICPAAGGCCLDDQQTCIEPLTRASCDDKDGAYLGDDSDCVGAVCTREDCCLPNGSCVTTLANLCTDAEGVPQPAGCSAETCVAEACCLPDESCAGLTVAICESRQGVPQGDGSDCADAVCARGRCCGYDGVCRDGLTLVPDCDPDDDLGGVFLAGESCSDECVGGIFEGDDCTLPDDCPAGECSAVCPEAGACCELVPNDDPVCARDLTADRCSVDAEQVFQGLGTSCANNDCDLGACCRGDGSCSEDVLLSDCDVAGGEVYHRDRLCRAVCPGSCCNDVGGCLESTEEGCDGEFTFGGDCATVDCAGACCAPEGTCSITSRTACEAGGGSFTVGQSCSPNDCVPVGACCTGNTNCSIEKQIDCEGPRLGVYQGDASECVAGECRLGGCCPAEGAVGDCPTVFPSQCVGGLNEFRPDDPTCNVVACKPRGACCIDGVAAKKSAEQCADDGGIYGGDGTVAEDVTCGLGACCLPEIEPAICEELTTVEACENVTNGSYQSDESSCPTCSNNDSLICRDDGDCSDVCKGTTTACVSQPICGKTCSSSGSSCTSDAQCETDSGVCLLADGTPSEIPCSVAAQDCVSGLTCQRNDTCEIVPCVPNACSTSHHGCTNDGDCAIENETCDPIACGAESCVFGICCRLDGSFDRDVTAADCSGSGDLFVAGGGDDACDERRGACCADAGCVPNKAGADCQALAGGRYVGDGTTCDPQDLCDAAVCCTDGICEENIQRHDCERGGGVFGGSILICDPSGLCDLGSCCLADDSCEADTVEFDCTSREGQFDGANTCGPSQCVPLGACCHEGLACAEETQAACEASGGYYQGDGAVCADDADACETGACCSLAGVCGSAFRAQCEGPFDDFTVGSNCSVVTCSVRGACCHEELACAEETQAACEASGGYYQGDVVTCADDADACETGACCPGAGLCGPTFRTQCEGEFDDFTVGSDCSVVNCSVRGACCVGSECRDDYTVAACDDAGGLYQGDGTDCGSVQCSIACTTLTPGMPPNCAIDARQPSAINDALELQGWKAMEVLVGPSGCTLDLGDVTVSSTPTGPAPGIAGVSQVGDVVTITLDAIIATENWTCVALTADAAEQVCIGFLPGDVNSDETSNPAIDLGAVIDCINNPGTCADWQENIDRDGATAGVLDITRLIDLYNGAGSFESWTGSRIDVLCPSQ